MIELDPSARSATSDILSAGLPVLGPLHELFVENTWLKAVTTDRNSETELKREIAELRSGNVVLQRERQTAR